MSARARLVFILQFVLLILLGCLSSTARAQTGEFVSPSPAERLMLAVANGDLKSVTSLVEAGANVNGRLRDGATPLMAASSKRQVAVAELLISHGASVNMPANEGATALMLA